MFRLERFLSSPAHYYIPLVPRLGTTYRLSSADKKLIEGQPLSPAAKKLRMCDGKDIIPDEHYHHFVYGTATRMAISVTVSGVIWGSGVPLFIPTALCAILNDPRINYMKVQELRQDLKS